MPKKSGVVTKDALDRRLIALLRENARASTAELARKLGLSRTTVQSRMQKLETKGPIAGYTVRVHDEYERGLIRAHVLITALPKLSSRVEADLKRVPEVRRLYAVSGAHDFIALVATETVETMNTLLDRIGALDGVDRTQSSIILSTRIER